MEPLGEYLKNIRKSINASLETVAAKTKININYLNAIEEGRFNDLPGEVFIKGFLRSYAKFLGIDEADVINRYNQLRKETKETVPLEAKIEEAVQRKETVNLGSKKITPIIGSAVVVFLIILAILFLRTEEPVKKAERREDKKIKIEKTEKPVEKPKDVIEAPVQALNKKETEPVPQPKAEQIKKVKNSLTLVINAAEQSWLMITIDEKEKKDILLQPGEKINLKAEKNFLITLGNAGGVDIEFNGKRLEPFGPKGRVVSNILLTREKIGRKKAESAIKKETDMPKEKDKNEEVQPPLQDSQ